jgi:hypothetical protein
MFVDRLRQRRTFLRNQIDFCFKELNRIEKLLRSINRERR